MPIDFEAQPLREMRKGRALAWNPHEIDFSQDAADWPTLNNSEQAVLLRQIVGFLVGERGVTHDLAPLQQTLRREKHRMEEEMYLTQQLFEESTHVEFFQLWINAALPGVLGVDIPYPTGEGNIFSHVLPEAMATLTADPTAENQMRATVTYHQIIEGVLAELGYEIFYTCLDAKSILPGLREGLRKIQQDEARHVAFGTYFARRLIAEHSNLIAVFEEEMERLHQFCIDAVRRGLRDHEETPPFGLDIPRLERFTETLFRRRLNAVLKGEEAAV